MGLGDFWEQQAKAWVRWAREPGHDSYWRFHRDRFLELLPPSGRLTADVGCGEGRLSRDLKELGHRVVAADRSPTMVRHAREADPELEVLEADAAALPLEDGAADLVVSFMALVNTDDLGAAVHEAARVLEPGGRYCVAIVHPLKAPARSRPARRTRRS
jgi:ubiquinone/menaquinone biosynthesis C-methylase UbiE